MPFIIGPNGGVNILSVPGGYSVMEDTGLSEGNPENGPFATVRYKCHSRDRYSFVQQLLGLWHGSPPNTLSYVGPFEYPPSPNLICTSIDQMEQHGKPIPDPYAGLPYLAKEYTIVTATFSRPTWQAATSGGYFSISLSGAGEFFTVPETTYWFGDGTPTNTPIGIRIGGAQITVTRYRMAFLPDQVSMPLAGYVNNAPFQIGWNIYDTGTLLFQPGQSNTESDPLGNLSYQFSYEFTFRQYDWNWYFHPNRTTGFALVTDGNGNTPYKYGNFNLLP